MASFLDLLLPESRRGIAQGFIQSGLTKRPPLSANALQRLLISEGVGYRRTTMLSDVRQWNQALSFGERMKFTTMGAKFGADRYVQTPWLTKSRFETKFQAVVRDPITGELKDKFVTIRHVHEVEGIETDDLTQFKTRGELQEKAEEYYSKYGIDPQDIVGPIIPILGLYNPNAP